MCAPAGPVLLVRILTQSKRNVQHSITTPAAAINLQHASSMRKLGTPLRGPRLDLLQHVTPRGHLAAWEQVEPERGVDIVRPGATDYHVQRHARQVAPRPCPHRPRRRLRSGRNRSRRGGGSTPCDPSLSQISLGSRFLRCTTTGHPAHHRSTERPRSADEGCAAPRIDCQCPRR